MGYTGLRPLYYNILDGDTHESICVSGNFLVGFSEHRKNWRFLLFGYVTSTYFSTYSLPDLQPGNIVSQSGYCVNVRADSDGQVYAGCHHTVFVLEIGETGSISVTRDLTAGGLLTGRMNKVAGFGPSPGQVWIYNMFYENTSDIKVYLIDANTDSVIQTFTPDPRDIPYGNRSWTSVVNAAALGHKILLHARNGYSVLLLFDSLTASPTNLTRSGEFSLILLYNNRFLLRGWKSRIRILDINGELLHTWDDLNGNHGFWMQLRDVAFWNNTLIVLGGVGDVAIFSML